MNSSIFKLNIAYFKGVGWAGVAVHERIVTVLKALLPVLHPASTAELQYVRFWEHKNNYTEFKLNQRVHLVIKRAFSQYFNVFISFLFVYWLLYREKITFYTIAFVKCIVESWRKIYIISLTIIIIILPWHFPND